MIRLICVGLGGMGRHDWNQAARVKDFTLVAGVDVASEHRVAFQHETGSPVFSSFTEARQQVKADAALIAVPDAFHAPLTLEAVAAGLDVICEKPMAETWEDALQMHRAAEKAGRMLMLHQQLRWMPAFYHARRLIQNGAVGEVKQLDFHFSVFSDVCLSGYRAGLPYLILQDLGIHHFDLIRYLSGLEGKRIFARTWTPNEEDKNIRAATGVSAILELTGGATACYTGKLRELIDATGYTCTARVTGSRGVLDIREKQLRLQTYVGRSKGEKLQVIEPACPEEGAWEAFARAIQTRQPPLTGSGDNLQSLAILFAAIRSAESGELVRIEETNCGGAIAQD